MCPFRTVVRQCVCWWAGRGEAARLWRADRQVGLLKIITAQREPNQPWLVVVFLSNPLHHPTHPMAFSAACVDSLVELPLLLHCRTVTGFLLP